MNGTVGRTGIDVKLVSGLCMQYAGQVHRRPMIWLFYLVAGFALLYIIRTEGCEAIMPTWTWIVLGVFAGLAALIGLLIFYLMITRVKPHEHDHAVDRMVGRVVSRLGFGVVVPHEGVLGGMPVRAQYNGTWNGFEVDLFQVDSGDRLVSTPVATKPQIIVFGVGCPWLLMVRVTVRRPLPIRFWDGSLALAADVWDLMRDMIAMINDDRMFDTEGHTIDEDMQKLLDGIDRQTIVDKLNKLLPDRNPILVDERTITASIRIGYPRAFNEVSGRKALLRTFGDYLEQREAQVGPTLRELTELVRLLSRDAG
jgi:hypothetical protein